MDKKLAGRYGEQIAADYLRKKGYSILGNGYRGPYGEIDIIAKINTVVAFVEVKTRQDDTYLPASTAVGKAKQQRIKATAEQWIAENQSTAQFSFDIIEVYLASKSIKHTKNAFV